MLAANKTFSSSASASAQGAAEQQLDALLFSAEEGLEQQKGNTLSPRDDDWSQQQGKVLSSLTKRSE
jgi:hypothetical protein